MLSIGALVSAEQASSYYEKDDYYAKDGEEHAQKSSWVGRGAQAQGLEGTIDKNAFKEVLEGKVRGGPQLGRVRDGALEHGPGRDLTFSAPKGVSIMALVAGDERLLQAHDESVRATLDYVETNLLVTRVTDGGGRPRTESNQGMVAAVFRHETSRALDPQLHSHAVIANMACGADGKWRSVEFSQIYEKKMFLGLVYRAELARRVANLGYEIAQLDKGLWDITSVPEQVVDDFSKRSAEIRALVRKWGTLNAETAAIAALTSRSAKKHVSREELVPAWKDAAGKFGFDPVAALPAAYHAHRADIAALEIRPASADGILLRLDHAGYFDPNEERVSEWFGRGAVEIDVDGPVAPMDLQYAFEGAVPNGPWLGAASDPESFDPGRELVFTAPAGVTVLALAGGDEALVDAHRQAVAEALTFVEDNVLARAAQAEDGSKGQRTDQWMLAALFHSDQRDRMLRSHAIVLNAMLDPDSFWTTGNPQRISEAEATVRKIYLASLQQRVAMLGYSVSSTGLGEHWDIAGVPAEIRNLVQTQIADAGDALTAKDSGGWAGVLADKGYDPNPVLLRAELNTPASLPQAVLMRLPDASSAIEALREGRAEPTWIGRGAQALNLNRQDRLVEATVEAAFAGIVPVGQEAGRQVGDVLDGAYIEPGGQMLQLSAPADLSLLALAGGDHRLIDAHDKAVQTALEFVEQRLVGVAGAATATRSPINMLAVAQQEEVGVGGLPHLRTRIAIAGLAQDAAEGSWHQAELQGLYHHLHSIGQAYRAALTTQTRALGYDVQADEVGQWSIAGLTPQTREAVFAGVAAQQRLTLPPGSPHHTEPMAWDDAGGDPVVLWKASLAFSGVDLQPIIEGTTRQKSPDVALAPAKTPRITPEPTGLHAPSLPQGGLAAGERLDPPAPRADNPIALVSVAAKLPPSLIPGRSIYDTRRPDAFERQARTGSFLSAVAETFAKLTAWRGSRQSRTEPSVHVAEPAETAVLYALAHLSERNASFAAGEVMREALRADAALSPESINQALQVLHHDGVVISGQGGRLTTQDAVTRETQSIAAMRSGQGAVKPLLSPGKAEQRLSTAALNDEQRQAARMVLTSKDRIVGIQGSAGAGKTTMLRAVQAALGPKAQIIGLAPKLGAAKVLERDTNISSRSLAYFLTKYQHVLDQATPGRVVRATIRELQGSIIILDEAGLAGTSAINKLQAIANKVGVRKLALVGDRIQHAGVEAGTPFSQLQDSGMQTARLENNIRQRTEAGRLAAGHAKAGRVSAALRALGPEGVLEVPIPVHLGMTEPGERLKLRAEALATRAAQVWKSLPQEHRAETLLVTADNATRAALTTGIRQVLVQEGRLGPQEHDWPTLRSAGLTEAQTRKAFNYRPGQRVQFYQDDKLHRIAVGTLADVEAIATDGRSITLRIGERSVQWSPEDSPAAREGALRVYNAGTLRVRVGDQLQWTISKGREGIASGEQMRIEAITAEELHVRNHQGSMRTIRRNDLQSCFLDHAYVLTSIGAQGETANAVIAVIDSARSQANSAKSFYVELTRHRDRMLFVVDDKTAVARAIRLNTGERMTALDVRDQAPGKPTAVEAEKSIVSADDPAMRAARFAVGHLSERQAAFTLEQLFEHAQKVDTSGGSLVGIKAAVEQLRREGVLLAASRPDLAERGYVTTGAAVRLEQSVLAGLDASRQASAPLELPADAGARLDADQKAALEMIAGTSDRVVAIERIDARATLPVFKELGQGLDGQVLVLTFSREAAAAVRGQTGLDSATLASFLHDTSGLDDGTMKPAQLEGLRRDLQGTVLIVDEAQRMSSKDADQLLKAAQALNLPRLVLSGSTVGQQGFRAGSPFEQVRDAGIVMQPIKTLVHQQTPAITTAVSRAAEGRVSKALAAIGQENIKEVSIPATATTDKAEQLVERATVLGNAAAKNWLSLDADSRARTIVLAADALTRRQTTNAMRVGLVAEGSLGVQAVTLQALRPVAMTEAERAAHHAYQTGQVLIFNRQDRIHGIEAGSRFTVGRIDQEAANIVLHDEGGQERVWSPAATRSAERPAAFQRESTELRGGDTVKWTITDSRAGIRAGDRLKVISIENGHISLQTAQGQPINVPLNNPRLAHLDHDYVAGIATGWEKSADQAIAVFDSERRMQTNQRALLTTLAKTAKHLTLVTDDKQGVTSILRDNSGTSVTALAAATEHENAGLAKASSADPKLLWAIEHVGERQSVFTSEDLLNAVLKNAGALGEIGAVELMKSIESAVREELLIRAPHAPDDAYTTNSAIRREAETISLMWQGQHRGQPVFGPASAEETLRGPMLSEGQLVAAAHMLSSRDRVTGLQGFAGTGKTTLFREVHRALQEQGWNAIGLAPTVSAVDTLASETGIASRTLQGFLHEHRHVLDGSLTAAQIETFQDQYRQSFILLDETSLASSGQIRDLLYVADQLEIPRIVLSGDTKQLLSVEAGRPFEALQTAGMDTAKLTEIFRQRNAELLQAVEATIRGDVRGAFRIIEAHHSIQADEDLAHTAATVWLSQTEEARTKSMLISPSNAVRELINKEVREGLLEEGKISGPAIDVVALTNEHFTRAQQRLPQSYQSGMIVGFSTDDQKTGIRGGDFLRVVSVEKDTGVVSLRGDGPTIRWSPQQHKFGRGGAGAVTAYQPKPLTLAQGDLIRWTRGDKDLGLINAKIAEIIAVQNGAVLIRLHNGKQVSLDQNDPRLRHIDYGWAATAFAAQGRTTDHVIPVINTRERHLTNMRTFYVELSRARGQVTLVTDDAEKAQQRLAANRGDRITALEGIGTQPIIDQKQPIVHPAPAEHHIQGALSDL
jgi:conjugative relaxase-like TrwC/TraI family protein